MDIGWDTGTNIVNFFNCSQLKIAQLKMSIHFPHIFLENPKYLTPFELTISISSQVKLKESSICILYEGIFCPIQPQLTVYCFSPF